MSTRTVVCVTVAANNHYFESSNMSCIASLTFSVKNRRLFEWRLSVLFPYNIHRSVFVMEVLRSM